MLTANASQTFGRCAAHLGLKPKRAAGVMRRLGPNIIVVDALRYSPDGARPIASWMPTSLLPIEADIFSRAATQLGSRGGADVYVRLRLPQLVDAVGEKGVMELARQVARAATITGLALEGDGGPASPERVPDPAEIRSIRAVANGASPLALRVMRAAMDTDPQLRLMILASAQGPGGPPEGADMIVWPPTSSAGDAEAQATQLKAAGWFKRGASGRIVLSVPQLPAKAQVESLRSMQAQGANAVALCPWTSAESDVLAPVFSAASFPHRP